MRGKLTAYAIGLGAALLPPPSHALSDSDLELMQNQLDDLEADMIERRLERMQRETDRQNRERWSRLDWERDQINQRAQDAHNRWMERCSREEHCLMPAKPNPSATSKAGGDRWGNLRVVNMEYCMREWHDTPRCNMFVDTEVDQAACRERQSSCVPLR